MKSKKKLMAKRTISAVMASCMIIGSGAALAADLSQTDIPTDHWAADELSYAIDNGYMAGYGNNTYKVDQQITRAEFVAMINNVMGYTEKSDKISNYTDIDEDDWCYEHFAIALEAGYLTGTSSTTLSPNALITREQAFTMIAQVLGVSDGTEADLADFPDADETSDWAVKHVGALVSRGIVYGRENNGVTTLEPLSYLSRAEGMVLLLQTIDADVEDEIVYVQMNIPYADFYEAEINNEDEVDVVTSATNSKSIKNGDGELMAGTYNDYDADAWEAGTQTEVNIKGVTYPVAVTSSDLEKLTATDDTQADYYYTALDETPSVYKTLTIEEDGSYTFGAAQGETTALDASVSFSTSSTWGDYQLSVDTDAFDEQTVYGVVVTATKDGETTTYGMRQEENIWRKTEIAWSSGIKTTEPHGNTLNPEHYVNLMGSTITDVTYYTSAGTYTISVDDIYVPVKFENTLSVESADQSVGSVAVTMEGFPEDYDVTYTITDSDGEVAEGFSCNGSAVTWTDTPAIGTYTLTVSDANGVYADYTATFVVQTAAVVAQYDADTVALIAADGASAEDFANYLSSISTVSVNGTSYSASGRGAVTIIDSEDGSINLEATSSNTAIFEAGQTYTIVVSATGYSTDLTFELTVAEAEDEIVYVQMNIPYADFYEAEINNEDEVDVVTSATNSKSIKNGDGELMAGTYNDYDADAWEAGTQTEVNIKGVTYPVAVTSSDLEKLTATDDTQADYYYTALDETPSVYKTLTIEEDGSYTFGAAQGETTALDASVSFSTSSTWGDYQLSVDTDAFDEQTVYGVVVTATKDGETTTYGMRQEENIWRKTEIAWSSGIKTTEPHGNTLNPEHYVNLMGSTITDVTYYTSAGTYTISVDDIYVPVKFENTLSVESADQSVGSVAVTMEGFPEDYDVTYTITDSDGEVAEGFSCNGSAVTWTDTPAIGTYTLTVSDANGVYADYTATFVVQTAAVVAQYDADTVALIAADGASAEDFANYLSSISTVSVNGTSYSASGRGAVTIIDSEDGSINLEATSSNTAIFEAGQTYTIVVSATGYSTDLTFELTVASESSTYTGTATTEPDGYADFDAYDITLDVVVTDGVIQSVTLNEDCTIADENLKYFNNALTNGRGSVLGLADQLTGQSASSELTYDVVSNATCSSHAIVEAVQDALSELSE